MCFKNVNLHKITFSKPIWMTKVIPRVTYKTQRKRMKKLVLLTAMATSMMFADAMTEIAGKAASSEVKEKAASSMMDSMKDQAMSKAKEQATDVAAEQASKAVGKETLTKETAKSAIKTVM
jgi:hypothetical protein